MALEINIDELVEFVEQYKKDNPKNLVPKGHKIESGWIVLEDNPFNDTGCCFDVLDTRFSANMRFPGLRYYGSKNITLEHTVTLFNLWLEKVNKLKTEMKTLSS